MSIPCSYCGEEAMCDILLMKDSSANPSYACSVCYDALRRNNRLLTDDVCRVCARPISESANNFSAELELSSSPEFDAPEPDGGPDVGGRICGDCRSEVLSGKGTETGGFGEPLQSVDERGPRLRSD